MKKIPASDIDKLMLLEKSVKKSIDHFIREDDLDRNLLYISKLPTDMVSCKLKVKSDLVMAGLPFFFEVFTYLQGEPIYYQEAISEYEGKFLKEKDHVQIEFDLPFSVALTGERLALNLLHRASSIATSTHYLCEKIKETKLKVLDTRKTTPGLRFLEKYAVTQGGGYNHRFGQADVFMIKDNHKNFFGGLAKAYEFFLSMNSFYNPVVAEIHSLDELKEAIELGIKHIMLDNFSPEDIKKAILIKEANMTYEVSGGIHKDNILNYALDGIDAVSTSSITAYPEKVDLSLKFNRINY